MSIVLLICYFFIISKKRVSCKVFSTNSWKEAVKIESFSQKKPSRNNRSTQKEKAFRVFGGFSGFVAVRCGDFLQ